MPFSVYICNPFVKERYVFWNYQG